MAQFFDVRQDFSNSIDCAVDSARSLRGFKLANHVIGKAGHGLELGVPSSVMSARPRIRA